MMEFGGEGEGLGGDGVGGGGDGEGLWGEGERGGGDGEEGMGGVGKAGRRQGTPPGWKRGMGSPGKSTTPNIILKGPGYTEAKTC